MRFCCITFSPVLANEDMMSVNLNGHTKGSGLVYRTFINANKATLDGWLLRTDRGCEECHFIFSHNEGATVQIADQWHGINICDSFFLNLDRRLFRLLVSGLMEISVKVSVQDF